MELSELIYKICNKELDFEIQDAQHKDLLQKIYSQFCMEKSNYEIMYNYYKGDTDAIRTYKMITSRSNLKINVNYIRKFVKEEVSYVVGNPLTYASRDGKTDQLKNITKATYHWDENHEANLMKYMLVFGRVYELYYLNRDKQFTSKIIKPTEGYCYCNNEGEPIIFIYEYTRQFDTTKIYLDVYTDKWIFHLDNNFNEVAARTPNIFGKIPVSVGKLSLEDKEDTLFKDLKGLQDAFETNLSDIGNEISDFRNAYLKLLGCKIDEDDLEKMKKLGILQNNNKDAKVEWLVKNIKDNFIQNTLDRYVDTIYQIACHINHNEKMQSNVSGVALRSRLIALENKCTVQQNAHLDMVKNRLSILCDYLNYKENKSNYDYSDIKVIYTPNVPQDDLATAQMFAQLPTGIVSNETARSRFSFINNVEQEKQRVNNERQEYLDSFGDMDFNTHNTVTGDNNESDRD